MADSKLERTTFETSRALEFFSEKELQMQIGTSQEWWAITVLKELIDNSLDACESINVHPQIDINIENDVLTIQDNGGGLPEETLKKSLDYMVRVSDKNHYISPTRGQLGNALKCAWAVPFIIDGEHGQIEIISKDKHHTIDVSLDKIAQKPVINHEVSKDGFVKNGTFIKIHWNEIASYLTGEKSGEIYKANDLINNYSVFNPHANFTLDSLTLNSANDKWKKWRSSDPTSPHWYNVEKLISLIAAYVNANKSKTVREFVSEFRGLSSTAKQKRVTELSDLSGACLIDLLADGDINHQQVERLLSAMKSE
jgi:DNA topoisomerase VI subunit B